jgi:dolichyl-phosphate beta-glucosyltransferase
MLLSVVLPTTQQAHRMRHTIRGIRHLQALLPYPIEVVVADTGSTDGTPELCEDAGFRVLRLDTGGYGAAVRIGMTAARGTYRMLIDCDWSVPPEQLQLLLPPAQTGFDVAIGSRHAPGAVRIGEPLSSYAFSRTFNRFVRALVLPDFADTQLPYRCFRAEAAHALFNRCREDSAAIHVEALVLARVFGLDIVEVPFDWTFSPSLRQPVVEAPGLLAALMRIRARLATGRYEPLQVTNPADETAPGWYL